MKQVKPGRPKISADARLSEHVHFLTTVATRETLATKAARSGVGNEAEYLRLLIDDAPLPSPRAASDPAAIAALNNYVVATQKVFHNVNQLTKATHTGRDFVHYWREIGAELEADLQAGREALQTLIEGVSE